MRYYKRRWEQGRGDQFDVWGPADYFFEVDDGGVVLRQMEVYANGTVLRYDSATSRTNTVNSRISRLTS